MTSFASAIALASLALLSYSCGSALGSLTTLWTLTWLPPSWRAMLPQKFSPAITLIAPAGSPLGAGEAHAAARATSPRTDAYRTPPTMTQEYCTIDLRNVFAYSQDVARPSPVSDQVKSLFSAENRHLWSIDELHAAVVVEIGAADYSTVFRAVSGL